jgi:hypothetical protein
MRRRGRAAEKRRDDGGIEILPVHGQADLGFVD